MVKRFHSFGSRTLPMSASHFKFLHGRRAKGSMGIVQILEKIW